MNNEDHDDDDRSENDEYASDADYDSAIQWDPGDPNREAKEAARKQRALQNCKQSLLDVRPASRWINNVIDPDPGELLGSLWRPGEVAVMFGETGIGKSIFATHIAESIARRRALEPFTASQARRVLYVDFRQSKDQFTRRYTCPRTAIGKLRVRYRFSGRFQRAGFSEDLSIPEIFDDNIGKYFRHSMRRALDVTGPDVMIIDDLSYIALPSTGVSQLIQRMRGLKIMAAETGLSVLVLANAKPPRRVGRSKNSGSSTCSPVIVNGSLSLSDLAQGTHIAGLADSVFAIGRSTLGEDVRYVKLLKSNSGDSGHSSPFTVNCSPSSDVLAYRLERTAGPRPVRSPRRTSSQQRESTAQPVTSPHVSKGISPTVNPERKTDSAITPNTSPATPPAALIPANSQLSHHNSQSPATPFIGFSFIGMSSEQDHLRDYQAEALRQDQAHARELKRLRNRSSKDILVDAVIDGSYGRYLNKYVD